MSRSISRLLLACSRKKEAHYINYAHRNYNGCFDYLSWRSSGCCTWNSSAGFSEKALNNTLGIAAIAMGIVLILKVKNLSAVVLTLVIGSILGELVMLDDRIRKLVTGVVHKLMNGAAADEQFLAQVSAVVILFCCGGTGWYGALNEGLTGDGSILITKSILDFVTACIFDSILGKIVPMLCIPQAIIYGALFLVSGAVQSFITPDIIADFSATGGIITLVPVSAWPVSKRI